MLLVLKAILLLVFILFVLPIIFFLLVGLFGRFFSVRIQRIPFVPKTSNSSFKKEF